MKLKESAKEMFLYISRWLTMCLGIVTLLIGLVQSIASGGSGGISSLIFGAILIGISAGLFHYYDDN